MKEQTNKEKRAVWKEAGGDYTKVQYWNSYNAKWDDAASVHSGYKAYRLKSQSVTFNGIEVYPVKEVCPEKSYYVLNPASNLGYCKTATSRCWANRKIIDRNCVYATEEYARQAARALGWIE